jgi:HD-GYP domain-containing protein (c-di-GMP phosphodiesterase class II)
MKTKASQDVSKLLSGVLEPIHEYVAKQNARMESLNRIGMALSSETNIHRLMEMILNEAQDFSNADGGTLYLLDDAEQALNFTLVTNRSLDVRMGGTAEPIHWPQVPLYLDEDAPNREMVAALCAIEGKLVNIADVYTCQEYDFEGTRKFDAKTGYRSQSMLVIPMKNREGEVIGVCQLINRKDPESGAVTAFTEEDEQSLLSLGSQAAIAITNVRLINDLRELLEAFIRSIAAAIDAKSPYTGGHVQKVAKLAMMLAHAVNEDKEGRYKEVHYSNDNLDQIRIAALMHDVGKITTPEAVMDKSTKLETICDRIELVRTRFELYTRGKELAAAEEKLALMQRGADASALAAVDEALRQHLDELQQELAFLEEANFGKEFMADEDVARVQAISTRSLQMQGTQTSLLTENEVENLTIRKGTLTEAERAAINHHAHMSNEMLEPLPFPKKLRRVPEIAGGHHEKLNGQGYPKGLSAEQLTLEARIMALADIFEALTAADRPYKKPKTLSETLRIIDFMVKDNELDPELVQFFLDKKLHVQYGQENLLPEQVDMA